MAGTFCWAQLATTDADAAMRFYTSLFGWTAHDDPLPGGSTYTTLRLGGGNVGALHAMRPPMHPTGTPPHWGVYVSVDNADDAATRAKRAGGQILAEPFDVMDLGRTAVLRDPSGAILSVWQPGKHFGFGYQDGWPGTVCWNELVTSDVDKAGAFYSAIFGWTWQAVPTGPFGTYHLFRQGDKLVAGMMGTGSNEGGRFPHWLAYVAVKSCDTATSQTAKLGGKTLFGPTGIPGIGRFAIVQDPQGATVGLVQRTT